MMRLAIFLCLFSAVLAAQGGDIVGRVYEYCDKTPLTLVNAELKNGNTLVQKKGVNANGIFRFVGVAPGTYVIEVSRKNYMFYPTVQSVTVESASGQKDIGGIGLYSSACLANLKTQDLERIATQVTTFSAPNREALVANLKILRSAVRSDEK